MDLKNFDKLPDNCCNSTLTVSNKLDNNRIKEYIDLMITDEKYKEIKSFFENNFGEFDVYKILNNILDLNLFFNNHKHPCIKDVYKEIDKDEIKFNFIKDLFEYILTEELNSDNPNFQIINNVIAAIGGIEHTVESKNYKKMLDYKDQATNIYRYSFTDKDFFEYFKKQFGYNSGDFEHDIYLFNIDVYYDIKNFFIVGERYNIYDKLKLLEPQKQDEILFYFGIEKFIQILKLYKGDSKKFVLLILGYFKKFYDFEFSHDQNNKYFINYKNNNTKYSEEITEQSYELLNANESN